MGLQKFPNNIYFNQAFMNRFNTLIFGTNIVKYETHF